MAELDEDIVLANVGLRVAELREERRMSQAELAQAMRVQLRQAQRYESGANLTLATLVRLARVLGVTPIELLAAPNRCRRRPGRPKGAG
ncbi:MAG: helix-turn-helix transcriptional regulator [Sandaracinaceae bacterium]|nr:helix-turn-helix transcriptional regulator [Sandaracinaceae bacterium]